MLLQRKGPFSDASVVLLGGLQIGYRLRDFIFYFEDDENAGHSTEHFDSAHQEKERIEPRQCGFPVGFLAPVAQIAITVSCQSFSKIIVLISLLKIHGPRKINDFPARFMRVGLHEVRGAEESNIIKYSWRDMFKEDFTALIGKKGEACPVTFIPVYLPGHLVYIAENNYRYKKLWATDVIQTMHRLKEVCIEKSLL